MNLFKTHIYSNITRNRVRNNEKLLTKYFERPEGHDTFPGEANLLRVDNINAKSYDKISEISGRININFSVDMEFHLSNEIKETLTVYHIGSIFCAGIKSLHNIDPIHESNIKVSLFRREKTIQFEVANQPCLEIVCRKLILEEFGRYALDNGKLIPLSDELNILGYQVKILNEKQDFVSP